MILWKIEYHGLYVFYDMGYEDGYSWQEVVVENRHRLHQGDLEGVCIQHVATHACLQFRKLNFLCVSLC